MNEKSKIALQEYREKRKSSIFTTSNDDKFVITNYVGCNEVHIKFLETGYETITSNNHIISGLIRDRLKPSVCGVGVLGTSQTWDGEGRVKEYLLWKDMLTRCYSKKSLSRKPTYIGCEVSYNFKYYDFFKDWCNKQVGFDQIGWHLDKDILIKGNKIYSEDTCVFVPKEINSLLLKSNARRGDCVVGVSYIKDRKKYRAGMNNTVGSNFIGWFNTELEAFRAYKQAKESYIKEVANKWKDQIDPRVYDALMNYEVEIDD